MYSMQPNWPVFHRQSDVLTINTHVLDLLGVYACKCIITQWWQQIGHQKPEEIDSSSSDEPSPVATWMHWSVFVGPMSMWDHASSFIPSAVLVNDWVVRWLCFPPKHRPNSFGSWRPAGFSDFKWFLSTCPWHLKGSWYIISILSPI